MLCPRNADEDPQTAIGRHVQEPSRRRREDPEAVAAQLDDQGKIPLDDLRRGKSESILIRGEGAVRDAPERYLVLTSEKELASNL